MKSSKKKGTIGAAGIISYGLGGVLINMALLGEEFGMYFLTDVARVPAATVGTILLLTSIFAAVMDPIIGNWADGTNTRFGKYRPFLIFGGLGMTVTMILRFTVPPFGPTGTAIYYGAVLLLAAFVFAATCVPWQGMMAVLSKDYNDRNSLLAARTIAGGIVGSLISIAVMGSVEKLGGGSKGWQLFAALCMGVGLIAMFFCQRGMKAVDQPGAIPTPPKQPLFTALFKLGKNKPVMCVVGAMIINALFITMGSQVAVHYYLYVLDDISVLAKTAAFGMPINMACAFLVPIILRWKKADKRMLVTFGTVLHIIKPIVIMFAGASLSSNTVIVLILLQRMGSSFYGAAVYSWIPDCVDYTNLKTGVGSAALISASATFAQKLGRALGQGSAGWLLAAGGYAADAAVTPSVISAILNMNGLYQVIGFALTLIPTFLFPISKGKSDEIRDQIRKRDEGVAVEAAAKA